MYLVTVKNDEDTNQREKILTYVQRHYLNSHEHLEGMITNVHATFFVELCSNYYNKNKMVKLC